MLSSITDLPSLCVQHIKVWLSCNNYCISLLWNSLPWSTHILFGLQSASFTISISSLRTALLVLLFKDFNHAYIYLWHIINSQHFYSLKTMIPFQLNLLHKYCLQIWDIPLFFFDFLLTGFCNSSASCWLTLTADRSCSFIKNVIDLTWIALDILHIHNFLQFHISSIFQTLTRNSSFSWIFTIRISCIMS